MSFGRIAGYALAVLILAFGILLVWVVLTDEEFASVAFLDPDQWEKSSHGFYANLTAERDGMVCVCGGYRCPSEFQSPFTKVEPTHLAFEGWGRPYYKIIIDPEAGDHPNWGRMVHGSQSCIDLKEGQAVTLHLQASEKNDRLKFSIE